MTFVLRIANPDELAIHFRLSRSVFSVPLWCHIMTVVTSSKVIMTLKASPLCNRGYMRQHAPPDKRIYLSSTPEGVPLQRTSVNPTPAEAEITTPRILSVTSESVKLSKWIGGIIICK